MEDETDIDDGLDDTLLTHKQRVRLLTLKPVYERTVRDIPELENTYRELTITLGGIGSGFSKASKLVLYVESIRNFCFQTAYSIDRIAEYCTEEDNASTMGNFDLFVQYYVYDLFAKVKTSTDVLLLMINHLYELDQKDEACGLDKEYVSNALRKPGADKSRIDLADVLRSHKIR